VCPQAQRRSAGSWAKTRTNKARYEFDCGEKRQNTLNAKRVRCREPRCRNLLEPSAPAKQIL